MSLPSVSKTGLIASPKKNIYQSVKREDPPNLTKCAIARAVQFSLRPFGGLYNPYAKGCSILCNHPGPSDVKTVVRQAKDAWLHDSKSHHAAGHTSTTAGGDDEATALQYRCNVIDAADLPEHVPEEFFRRYTGSDSRPMTPTPTVASGRTRASTGSYAHGGGGGAGGSSHGVSAATARRCFTPDPATHSGSAAKQRQQLILDLRRSHSQETLYWNASSELTPTATATTTTVVAVAAAKATAAAAKSARALRLCEQEAKRRAEERAAAQQRAEAAEPKQPPVAVCINALDDVYADGEDDDDDAPRRRGRRKKKSNKPAGAATYKVSEEPETQIATLGPDSPNQSQRASLVPNGTDAQAALATVPGERSGGREERVRQSSFISEEAMMYLRRGLTVDVVEATFDRYMNRALMEAIRTVRPEQLAQPSQALLTYQAANPIAPIHSEKWLSMPRKYTRKSVRFTVPINTYDLETLTPYEYVSRHVWLSDYRKELCRCVFVKFQPPPPTPPPPMPMPPTSLSSGEEEQSCAGVGGDGGDSVSDWLTERTLDCATVLDAALGDVLGFYGTAERVAEIRAMLCMTADMGRPVVAMNFRSWCGVVAFGERFLNALSRETDPCDEIEVADFASLERKFRSVNVNEPMRRLLTWIKYN